MKLNWGTSIVIAMLLFMGFILSFVWKATFNPKYDHALVSENYYEEDINYPREQEQKELAKTLKIPVKITQNKGSLVVEFPAEFADKKVIGTIEMKRLSNKKLDVIQDLALQGNKQTIAKDLLVEGRYQFKLYWESEGKKYMIRQVIDMK